MLPAAVVAVLKQVTKQQAQNRLLLGPLYQDHDLVFCNADGNPLSPSTISHRFHDIAPAAEFPGLRFHDLRHTHATMLLTQGVHPKIVQERLGHESINITLDTYSHVLPGLQEDAIRKLDTIIGHQSGTKNKNNRRRDGYSNT